jgi:tyrosine aminotransferase
VNNKNHSKLVVLGDPTVFGNFSTAKEVKDAMIRALEGGKADGYAPSVGSETARIAIVDRYKNRFNVNFRVENLFITSGCSGALDLAISVICGPGDALLIPQPGFTLYGTLAGSKGINTVNYGLDENKNWEIKLEEVEEAIRGDERIKAWIINNPSNPCGSVYSREHLLSCLKGNV